MATNRKSPLQHMRDEHKDKETLVDRVLDVIDRGVVEKDEFKAKLLAASNKKLLRLLEAGQVIKKVGSVQAVAEVIAKAAGKAKDKDYVARLAQYTAPRLVSMYNAVAGKTKAA